MVLFTERVIYSLKALVTEMFFFVDIIMLFVQNSSSQLSTYVALGISCTLANS